MRTGAIKWFDQSKQFGFISADEGGDVYLPREAVPPAEIADLRAGQRVQFEAINGRLGPKAIKVGLIDTARRQDSLTPPPLNRPLQPSATRPPAPAPEPAPAPAPARTTLTYDELLDRYRRVKSRLKDANETIAELQSTIDSQGAEIADLSWEVDRAESLIPVDWTASCGCGFSKSIHDNIRVAPCGSHHHLKFK